MKHKHCDLIKAWADGAEIQVKPVDWDQWADVLNPNWNEQLEYRIKPKTIKYRNFLWEPSCSLTPNKKIVCVCSEQEHEYEARDKWQGFIKWLGDWQEVVVE